MRIYNREQYFKQVVYYLRYVFFIWKVYFLLFLWSLLFILAISREQTSSQVSQILFKNEKFANKSKLLILFDHRLFFTGWTIRYHKRQVKLRKLNPHETFLYLVWKIYYFNFIFSAFLKCHPNDWSIFVVSCWATYPK